MKIIKINVKPNKKVVRAFVMVLRSLMSVAIIIAALGGFTYATRVLSIVSLLGSMIFSNLKGV